MGDDVDSKSIKLGEFVNVSCRNQRSFAVPRPLRGNVQEYGILYIQC